MPEVDSDKAKAIWLQFKRATAQGLDSQEAKSLDTLQKEAIKRRMQQNQQGTES